LRRYFKAFEPLYNLLKAFESLTTCGASAAARRPNFLGREGRTAPSSTAKVRPRSILRDAAVAEALRKSDIKFLDDVAWGTHACLFYETKKDLLDTVVPYFKAGLESKEFCLWAISEPVSEEDTIRALRHGIPGFDRYLADQSIEILPGREWYLGDGFDLQRITGGWLEKLRGARARGYRALRVSGNAFWLGTKHWNDFRAYERELKALIAGQPISLLCTYPLDASLAADITEVSFAHQFAIVRRQGRWEFFDAVKAPAPTPALTPRETEVLTWVAKGKTAREIAQILHIAKRTVDEHVQMATRKLGAANRTQAVAFALQNRLVKV
jgi:DNA-binding CsgD family transcriptional regulator